MKKRKMKNKSEGDRVALHIVLLISIRRIHMRIITLRSAYKTLSVSEVQSMPNVSIREKYNGRCPIIGLLVVLWLI